MFKELGACCDRRSEKQVTRRRLADYGQVINRVPRKRGSSSPQEPYCAAWNATGHHKEATRHKNEDKRIFLAAAG